MIQYVPQWLLDTWADPLYRVLLVALALETGLLGIQVAWLLLQTLHVRRRIGQAQRFEKELGPRFPVALHQADERVRWVRDASAYPAEILREFIDGHLQTLTAGARAQVVEIYRDLGLLRRDLAESQSWSWWKRLLAVRRLSLMPDAEVREGLRARTRDIFPIRILAARALAERGMVDALVEVISSLPLNRRLMEQPLYHVLHQLPEAAWPALLTRWDDIQAPHVRRVVLVASAGRHPQGCLALLQGAAGDPDPAVRCGACQAAARLAGPKVEEVVLALARDPAWEVRAQAANALRSLRIPEGLSLLRDALRDEHFWVRQNAAAALGALGPEGRRTLEATLQAETDRFAADAAQQELQRLDLLAAGGAQS